MRKMKLILTIAMVLTALLCMLNSPEEKKENNLNKSESTLSTEVLK
jgi:hypothetical protein|tara:strand:+ start:140 stop:277 length:138 start_codon:yes stop_codon:yes gene_type:complete